MVGPQQTTGLIGQKWKTGNGLELTGTNRPTQTTTPPNTHHTPSVRGKPGGERYGKSEASTIRSTPNPVHQPHTTHASMWLPGAADTDNRTESHQTTAACTAHVVVSVVTATGKRPAPSRTRKLSLTAPMVLHPPGCGRVGHHRAHTTGIGSAFTKADPILLSLLLTRRQGAYAL